MEVNMKTNKISYTFLAVILSVGHFLFLTYFFTPAYTTPDANGYFTQARLIAENGQTGFKSESVLQYIGPHWHSPDNEFYYATFPPGFPFLLALVIKIFGFNAAFYVNLFLASLSLFIFFFVCRFWLSNSWSFIATGIMALNPFANEHALFGDSHTSLIFFLLLGLLLLQNTIRKQNHLQGLLAGICIGIIPTIRYAEFLFIPAFALYSLLLLKDKRIRVGTLTSFAIGISIPLLTLAIRNQIAFGSFLKTGYSLPNQPALFAFNYFVQNFIPFIIMLVLNGAGLMFILGIIGISLLYMAYYWPADQQSMRFLLPTFFIYTLAGVWTLNHLKNERTKRILTCATLIVSILWGSFGSIMPLISLKERGKPLADIYEKIRTRVPEQSILITNEGINQFLDYYGKWSLIDIAMLKIHLPESEELIKQNIPIKPIRNSEAAKKYEYLNGKELFQTFSNDLSLWTQNKKKVFLVGYVHQIEWFKRNLLPNQSIIIVGKITLPKIANNVPFPTANKQQRLMNPVGRNQIFDLVLNGQDLIICKLTVNEQN
jgi:hypothetical protein